MKLKSLSNMLHKLRSVENKMVKKFEDSTGFSLTRYEILTFLRDNGDSLQTEISEYLEIDPSAITRHLRILEDAGYVTKNRNKDNAREIIVSLTDFSISELEKCKKKQKDNKCELPVPFTNEDIDSLMKILEKIEEKL